MAESFKVSDVATIKPNPTLKRQHVMVDWNKDIQPILNILTSDGTSESAIMEAIGYSKSALVDGRRDGKARLSTRYALMGLLSERTDALEKFVTPPPVGHNWTFEEASNLFDAARTAVKVFPQRAKLYQRLMATLAAEMVRLQGEGK